MEYAIECMGLVKHYPDFSLGPVSLAIDTGTVCGLIGSNGAGKTTLIKMLLGLTTPDSGTISLFGSELSNPENMSDSTKGRIGVVFDTCAFTREAKVVDIEKLGRASYRDWDSDTFLELASSFGLDSKKQISKLSRGMGMKLSIAFALAHDPDLLILDEATAGLDPIARDEVLDILRDYMLDEQHTILMSTHITSDLEKIADKIICIESGQIVFTKQKEEISNEAGIAHVRTSQLDKILESISTADSELTYISRPYGADVLITNRFDFAKTHTEIPIDPITIEDYMSIILKGTSK